MLVSSLSTESGDQRLEVGGIDWIGGSHRHSRGPNLSQLFLRDQIPQEVSRRRRPRPHPCCSRVVVVDLLHRESCCNPLASSSIPVCPLAIGGICSRQRFGLWDVILAEPLYEDSSVYATGLASGYYARGIAFASKGLIEEAEAEQVLQGRYAPRSL